MPLEVDIQFTEDSLSFWLQFPYDKEILKSAEWEIIEKKWHPEYRMWLVENKWFEDVLLVMSDFLGIDRDTPMYSLRKRR